MLFLSNSPLIQNKAQHMGVVPSIVCCTERSKELQKSPPARVMSSKVSNIVNKLGSLDEFSETVRQLNSAASLPHPPARSSFQHPWATMPVSVAAQAAINLAARLRASSKDHSIRDQYWKSGCLSPLVGNLLGAKELDKVHAALMALSAISDICDNQEILDELVQLDSLTVLVKITQSKTVGEGARMTAAGVIRNVVGKSKKQSANMNMVKSH